jgi:hypothetical protein
MLWDTVGLLMMNDHSTPTNNDIYYASSPCAVSCLVMISGSLLLSVSNNAHHVPYEQRLKGVNCWISQQDNSLYKETTHNKYRYLLECCGRSS